MHGLVVLDHHPAVCVHGEDMGQSAEIGQAAKGSEIPAFELRWRSAQDKPCSIKIYANGKVVSEPNGNPASLVIVNRISMLMAQAFELGRQDMLEHGPNK